MGVVVEGDWVGGDVLGWGDLEGSHFFVYGFEGVGHCWGCSIREMWFISFEGGWTGMYWLFPFALVVELWLV